jgi:succinate dehydrogenase / fumarate reductase flavoprotein subunit
MSNVPGLHVIREANFSDHGANRLGASALMQGLADGYFVLPYTIGNYLGSNKLEKVTTDHDAFAEAEAQAKEKYDKLLSIKGNKTVKEFHQELGSIVWDYIGMSRNEEGLKKALELIPKLRDEFWQNVKIAGTAESLNKNLEFAGRVADYFELAELMAKDALNRKESCGGHLREESQTPEGEALRNDEEFTYVAAWEFKELGKWELHKEPLVFENVKLTQRSYK